MTNLSIDVSKTGWTIANNIISVAVCSDNIEVLEAACKKYREETKLPGTMEECIRILRKMQGEGKQWFVGGDCGVMPADNVIADSNAFPARWQAEKLHALACMEQAWIALHTDGFEWVGKQHSWHFRIDADGRINNTCSSTGYMPTPFPFVSEPIWAQARKILTDDLIKVAFSTK